MSQAVLAASEAPAVYVDKAWTAGAVGSGPEASNLAVAVVLAAPDGLVVAALRGLGRLRRREAGR